jgi:hypothetical protein
LLVQPWGTRDESGSTSHNRRSRRKRPANCCAGEAVAVSYSGFRQDKHPDRGDGAVNPSDQEMLEDLEILVRHGFRLIRMYDSGDNTRTTLELIRKHELPVNEALVDWSDHMIPLEQVIA